MVIDAPQVIYSLRQFFALSWCDSVPDEASAYLVCFLGLLSGWCVVHSVSLCVVGVVLTMVIHGMIQSYGIIGTIASVFCGFDAFCRAVMWFFLCQPVVLPRTVSVRSAPSGRCGAGPERTLLIFDR